MDYLMLSITRHEDLLREAKAETKRRKRLQDLADTAHKED